MATDKYIVEGIVEVDIDGTPTAVAGISTVTLDEEYGYNEVRNSSTSGNFAELTNGGDGWTASVECDLMAELDQADGTQTGIEQSQKAVIDAARAKDEVTLIVDRAGTKEQAKCHITSSSTELNNDLSGPGGFSFEVQGIEPWSPVA